MDSRPCNGPVGGTHSLLRRSISPQHPLKAHRDHYCVDLGGKTGTQELGRAKFSGLIGRMVGLACAHLTHVLVKSSSVED